MGFLHIYFHFTLKYQTGFRDRLKFTKSRISRPQAAGNVAASGMELSKSMSNGNWFCELVSVSVFLLMMMECHEHDVS